MVVLFSLWIGSKAIESYNDYEKKEKTRKVHELEVRNREIELEVEETKETAREHAKALKERDILKKSIFKKPDENYINTEMEEICNELKKQLYGKSFDDLLLIIEIGKGSFAFVFLCSVKQIVNKRLVVKLVKDVNLTNDYKKNRSKIEKDVRDIPFHKNVVTILYFSGKNQIDKRKFPEFDEEKLFGPIVYPGSFILMGYFPFDLFTFIEARGKSFSLLEVAYMIKGMLEGGKHLHDYLIVHRDIHEKNIFINPEKGQLVIGDLGCSLKSKSKDFLFAKDCEGMFTNFSRFESNSEMSSIVNENLPPELWKKKKRNEEDENEDYSQENTPKKEYDYSGCDMYMIGQTCSKILLNCKDNDQDTETLVEQMMNENPQRRIKFKEAINEIKKIIKRLENSHL